MMELQFLSRDLCFCGVCVLHLWNWEMSVVAFRSFMTDTFAVWPTNYVFNVEQIVFSACEID